MTTADFQHQEQDELIDRVWANVVRSKDDITLLISGFGLRNLTVWPNGDVTWTRPSDEDE